MADRLQTEKFYDSLAKSWDITRPGFTAEIFAGIMSYLDKRKPLKVLDFGCGTGLLCRYLSESLPGAEIEGVDISSQMVEKAKANCPGCNFYAGSIFSLELKQYDAIVSKDVFNHIEDIGRTILRLDALLKAGGVIVITNRERKPGVKEGIISALEAAGFKVAVKMRAFDPTEEEIDAFVKALPDLDEAHKRRISDNLKYSGEYYFIRASKA